MKKLLLTLLLLFTLGLAAKATEVTYDFKNNDYGMERSASGYMTSGDIKNGDITLTMSKTGGNGFRLWTDGLRVYKTSGGNATLKVTVPDAKITGIKMTVATKFASVKINNTDATYTASSKTYSWSGSVDNTTDIVMTQTAGNYAIVTLVVTYESTGNPDDTRETFSFEGFKSYTIPAGESVNYNPALPEKKPTNIEYTSTDEEVATADNAGVHAYKVGTATITASWKDDAVFKDGSATFTVTVVDAAKSIAELLEKAPNKDDKVYVNFPMTVTYANGLYGYVTDGNGGFTMLYGDYNLADKDIIPAGWTAVNSLFNGLEEYTVDGSLPAITGKGTFTPREIALSEVTEDIMNEIVIIKNVNFASATLSDKSSNFDGTNGGATLQFRNNFLIASVEAGDYDVLAAVGYYSKDNTNTVQAYPIEYMPVNKLVGDYVLVETTLHPKAGRVTVEYMFEIENWDGSEPQYDVQVFVNGTNVNATEVEPKTTAKAAAENAKAFEGKLIYEADALKNAAKEDVKVEFKATVGKTVVAGESAPSTTTGIEDVTVEGEGEAEYYNLQGLRVAQPEAGQLYIKRQGGKAVKVRF